jgi:hypothetical protein
VPSISEPLQTGMVKPLPSKEDLMKPAPSRFEFDEMLEPLDDLV